jgi:histidyl-tRNA synthetase
VKDIRSGDQVDADAASWQPPPEDERPRIVVSGGSNDEERTP